MSLYEPVWDYGDGRMQLRKGRVVDLDDEAAEQVQRDSPGVLRKLTDDEVAGIAAAVREVTERTGVEVTADWRPEQARPAVASGGGETMHSGNMWGGRR